MSEKTGPRIFDAFPFLVLAKKQTGWEQVRAHLQSAAREGFQHSISLINLGEVYYMLHREHGDRMAMQTVEEIRAAPIEIVIPSFDQMLQAARFKASGGISYADCFAAALSLERGTPVLTGDPEFSLVERQGVQIDWLPRNR